MMRRCLGIWYWCSVDDSGWRPVAYASRGYAQIKKEALALMWAYEHLSDYVMGKTIAQECT